MSEPTALPEDLVESDRILSGGVSTLLRRFERSPDWTITDEQAGLVPDAETRFSLGYGPHFEEGQPGSVAAQLAERAMAVLVANNIVVQSEGEPGRRTFKLDIHGHLIPNPYTTDGLEDGREVYVGRQPFPISVAAGFSSSHFTRRLEAGAPVLSVRTPGVRTGFVIAPSESKESPWKVVRAA